MAPPDESPEPAPVAGRSSLRQRVHDILEATPGIDSVGGLVSTGIVILILLNALAFTVETIPEIGDLYAAYFATFNVFSVAVFTVEYLLRLWSCVELPGLRLMPSGAARLRYAARPLMVIDLAVILPYYLGSLFSVDLRVLRVLRLFRFLKIARYSQSLQTLGRVLVNEWRALLGALLLMLTMLLLASTGMYFIEHEAQPEHFGSVPAAAWWGMATLTTIGYGDVVPITPLGKVFGGVIMVIGVGLFAIPIAILATGFSQESARNQFVVTWGMVARVPLFAGLDAAAVAEVMSLLHSKTVPAGGHVVRKGEQGDAMYFVASGEAAVETGGEPVLLGEGDFFGEMSLINNRPRTHTVSARTGCRLLVLDRSDFERLCYRHPAIKQHVQAVAAQRLAAAPKPARRKASGSRSR